MGLPKKIPKTLYVVQFSVNHTKSNIYKEIPLNANLSSHNKILFSEICSNGYMGAKRVSRAIESSAFYANQVNQANQGRRFIVILDRFLYVNIYRLIRHWEDKCKNIADSEHNHKR